MFLTLANIGRNVNGELMPARDWMTFCDLVADTVQSLSQHQTGRWQDAGFSQSTGTGHWMGVPEDMASFQLCHESEIDGVYIEKARERLEGLAREFDQDAIAFTHHIESRLIEVVRS